jgi:hypothetical protein
VIRLRWWKERLGHLKLADITPALLVEQRNKLAREPYTKARPGAPRSTLEEGATAREFKRVGGTVNRYMAYLSHVLSIARREWHWVSSNPFEGAAQTGQILRRRGGLRCGILTRWPATSPWSRSKTSPVPF